MTIFRDPVSVTENYSSRLQQLPLLTRNGSAGIFRPHCLGTNGQKESLTPRRLHPAQLEVLY
uniref:Uncharacterized protein n=1 Tax=Cercocebus atys TaxID=9531 RepID=A0A2K5LKS9_CERAT